MYFREFVIQIATPHPKAESKRNLHLFSLAAWIWAVLCVFMGVTDLHAVIQWGGNARTAHASSRVDTAGSGSFDQQYMFHFSGTPALAFRYFTSVRFRRLRSWSDVSGNTWRTEVQPTANIVWSNPFYKLRGEYVHRQNRDRLHVNELTGRSAGINFQTNLKHLPRLYGRYDWTQSVNDLELLGIDTRQERISVGSRYTHEKLSLQYDYSDRRTRNHLSGLKQNSGRHIGRTESSLNFIRGAVTLQSSYMITYRTEKEVRPLTAVTLLPISAVSGLYADDPTPEHVTLDSRPTLIDGNLESPASLLMNLSSDNNHNFGMDFGSPVTLDHLFLSTDTLANPDLRWAIYVSDDNLTWDIVRDFENSFYNVTFLRYEVDFSSLTTRYVKLVLEPVLQNEAVYATELRALISQAQETAPDRSTDHRAGLNVRVHPLSWLNGGIDGTYFKSGRSQTSLAREQDGLNASLHARATSWLELSGQYQFSRTAYPERAENLTDTEVLSLTANSRWMNSLSTRISAYRQREKFSRQLSRRQDGAKFRANVEWLPDLKGITDISYSENHQFLTNDLYYSASVGQSFDTRPTSRSILMIEYRLYNFHSRDSSIPSFRETVRLRGSYRWTSSITSRGNAAFFRETNRSYRSWSGVVSWSVTPRLPVSLSVNRTEPHQGGFTTLMTLQSTFRWTTRTDLSISYSHSNFADDDRENVSRVRFSFHTSF